MSALLASVGASFGGCLSLFYGLSGCVINDFCMVLGGFIGSHSGCNPVAGLGPYGLKR